MIENDEELDICNNYLLTNDGFIYKILDYRKIWDVTQYYIQHIFKTTPFLEKIRDDDVKCVVNNLLDVIKPGDYVNGCLVCERRNLIDNKPTKYLCVSSEAEIYEELHEEDIKDVITEQQYKERCTRLRIQRGLKGR